MCSGLKVAALHTPPNPADFLAAGIAPLTQRGKPEIFPAALHWGLTPAAVHRSGFATTLICACRLWAGAMLSSLDLSSL